MKEHQQQNQRQKRFSYIFGRTTISKRFCYTMGRKQYANYFITFLLLFCCLIQSNVGLPEEVAVRRNGTQEFWNFLKRLFSSLFPSWNPPSLPSNGTFEILNSSAIVVALQRFSLLYPNLIQLTTSQAKYGLPAAGTTNDCPYDTSIDGCFNYIATIQDYVAHPDGSDTSNRLPEVFWSGALHGNERVGPTTVIETMNILLNATTCESYQWTNDSRAPSCKQYLYGLGIDDNHRRWLARIVTTRRIVVVPTANALGYYRVAREEGSYDPNRDFAFDLRSNSSCMRTIAARTINEVYRDHIFQMSLTFHGGMEVLSYEWGATSWVGFMSPDDISQNRITAAMSQYAGSFSGTSSYKYGASNDVVYAIRGGMEDWAYAGSFDLPRVNKCSPTTYGGYPKLKTTYDNATLRSIIILIEASNLKIPFKNTLGSTNNMLNPKSSGNGHVTRNIRLSLLSADLVEPYVAVSKVNGVNRTVDLIPLMNRTTACKDLPVNVTYNINKPITIEWMVGGALEVDNTMLYFDLWDNIPSLTCTSQPSITATTTMNNGTMLTPTAGIGRFHRNSSAGTAPTLFRATIPPTSYKVGDRLVLLISARVDNVWKNKVRNVGPDVPPQTHLVNARTNPNWVFQSSTTGKIVRGRLDWFAVPLGITIV